MILPSKHISQERALLTIGTAILKCLEHPKTVSATWEAIRDERSVHYDWFVLALDLLYAIGAVNLHEGLLSKKGQK